MPRTGNPHRTELSRLIRSRRRELGISLGELERRTGLHNSRLSRWERGLEAPDRPARLVALAEGLELPLADLYLAAGIKPVDQLPSHRIYLRSKYGEQVPPEALADIAAYAEKIATRYGADLGPNPGEDEEPAPETKQERQKRLRLERHISEDVSEVHE